LLVTGCGSPAFRPLLAKSKHTFVPVSRRVLKSLRNPSLRDAEIITASYHDPDEVLFLCFVIVLEDQLETRSVKASSFADSPVQKTLMTRILFVSPLPQLLERRSCTPAR
jgi:hypothetical protein